MGRRRFWIISIHQPGDLPESGQEIFQYFLNVSTCAGEHINQASIYELLLFFSWRKPSFLIIQFI